VTRRLPHAASRQAGRRPGLYELDEGIRECKLSTSVVALSLCAILIAGVLIWSVADRGLDMGNNVTADVLRCERDARASRRCVVQLESNHSRAFVYLPAGRAGEKVILAQFRRPLSGREFYAPAP